MDKVYIPARLYTRLKSIYSSRTTLVCGCSGSGKSTILREFIRRSRPADISCRFITREMTADETFAAYCRIVIGREYHIPATEKEFLELRDIFLNTRLQKPLLVVLDNERSADMLLGDLYCARIITGCSPAQNVITNRNFTLRHDELIRYLNINKISQEELALTLSETAEYLAANRCDASAAELIHSGTGGTILSTRLCSIILKNNGTITDFDPVSLIVQAVLKPLPPECTLAALCASEQPSFSEGCSDLQHQDVLVKYYGADKLSLEAMQHSLAKVNSIIPLISHNKKSDSYTSTGFMTSACIREFRNLPDTVRRALYHCAAINNERAGRMFLAFCYYCFAGEYDYASTRPRQQILPLDRLIRSKETLYYIVTTAPLSNKKLLPFVLRAMSMLMLTDHREEMRRRSNEVIRYISTEPQFDESERRSLLCYAYNLKIYEDFYRIDKMGTHVKRAYELYSGEERKAPAYYSWTLFTPSVFTLVHRYSLSVANESEQFCRYHKMYCEMISGGDYLDDIYVAEANYYLGDFQRSLTASYEIAQKCTSDDLLPTKLIALYVSAKSALLLGNYEHYTMVNDEISYIRRYGNSAEISLLITMIAAFLCCMKQGDPNDLWAVYSMSDELLRYNRYAAVYCYLLQGFTMLWKREYDELLERCDMYLFTAAQAHNETALLMMEITLAATHFKRGSIEKGIKAMKKAMDTIMPTDLIIPAVEICIHFPLVFEQALEHLGSEYTDTLQKILDTAAPLRRNISTLRSYELTLLNSSSNRRRALSADIGDTAENRRLAQRLGISEKALEYALLAAKGCPNDEIAEITGSTLNSIKSSLKRTYAKLGIRSRNQLKSIFANAEKTNN